MSFECFLKGNAAWKTAWELWETYIDLFSLPIVASKCVIAAFPLEIRFFRSEHIRTHSIWFNARWFMLFRAFQFRTIELLRSDTTTRFKLEFLLALTRRFDVASFWYSAATSRLVINDYMFARYHVTITTASVSLQFRRK